MKKSTVFKWMLLILLMVYCVGMTVWAKGEAMRHTCVGIEVEVEGDRMLDTIIRKGVREELRHYRGKIVGTPLHQLNTRKIEKYLSGLSNFESVECIITSDGRLLVNIVPLIPVMRVFYKDNSYYINKDGKHIESKAEFFSDVPVVEGEFSRSFTPRDILPLIRYIESDKDLRSLVSMVVARDASNLMIVPKVKGHIVNFGDTTRLPEKWQSLRLFYHKVMPYKGWEEYDTISVKYRGQIVATRRDKTKLNHGEDYQEEEDLEEGTLPVIEGTDALQKENKNKTEKKDKTTDNTGV